jgi:hypothetical protein
MRGREVLAVCRGKGADQDDLRGAVLLGCACQDGDPACGHGQPGQAGAVAAAGLARDPARVRETVRTLMNNFAAICVGAAAGVPARASRTGTGQGRAFYRLAS